MVFNFKNLLLTVDNFGQGIEFTVNKNSKAKTAIGGLLSILMVLMCITMFYLNVQNLLDHKNPVINVETQILTEAPNITMTPYSMPMAIGIYSIDLIPIYNPRYFKIFAYYYSMNKFNGNDINITVLNMMNCTKDNFPLINQKFFDHAQISSHLCINSDIKLYGALTRDDTYFSYLRIGLTLCKNNTESDNCAPLDEIQNFLFSNMNFINLFLMNSVINPQNYTDPISRELLYNLRMININSSKRIYIYIREEILESDDGFLFQLKDTNNSIAFDYLDYDDRITVDGIFVEYLVFASSRRIIHHRIYTKIQTILANVGGIANVLRITFTICTVIFSLIKRDEAILNRILEYDLDIDKNDKENEQDIKKQMIQMNMKNEDKKQSAKRFNLNFDSRDQTALNNNLKFRKIQNIVRIENKLSRSRSEIINDNVTNINQNRVGNISEKGNIDLIKNSNLHNYDNSSVNLKLSPLSRYNEKSVSNNLDFENNKCNVIDKTKTKINYSANILNILKNRKKKRKLKFSFCEVIRAFLCCNYFMNARLRNKKALYDKSKFVVEQFLDISNVIQNFEEFEKLKIVLLNKKQLALFNFLSNELISFDEEKLKNHNISKYKRFNKNQEELIQIIMKFGAKMSTSNKVTKIDKKLYSLLNPIFK